MFVCVSEYSFDSRIRMSVCLPQSAVTTQSMPIQWREYDSMLVLLVAKYGPHWSKIMKYLPTNVTPSAARGRWRRLQQRREKKRRAVRRVPQRQPTNVPLLATGNPCTVHTGTLELHPLFTEQFASWNNTPCHGVECELELHDIDEQQLLVHFAMCEGCF